MIAENAQLLVDQDWTFEVVVGFCRAGLGVAASTRARELIYAVMPDPAESFVLPAMVTARLRELEGHTLFVRGGPSLVELLRGSSSFLGRLADCRLSQSINQSINQSSCCPSPY